MDIALVMMMMIGRVGGKMVRGVAGEWGGDGGRRYRP